MGGASIVRRAFGNFVSGHGKGWLGSAGKFALDLVQVISTSNGKNASDIRLAIDAIEILRSADVDHFCLVSGDSDFTPLAVHLRAAGMMVTGYGGPRVSDHFREACNRFVILPPTKTAKAAPPPIVLPPIAAVISRGVAGRAAVDVKRLHGLVRDISEAMPTDAAGWLAASTLGSELRRNDRTFSVKTYGSASLGKALKQLPGICLEQRDKGLFYKFRKGASPSKTAPIARLSVVAY